MKKISKVDRKHIVVLNWSLRMIRLRSERAKLFLIKTKSSHLKMKKTIFKSIMIKIVQMI